MNENICARAFRQKTFRNFKFVKEFGMALVFIVLHLIHHHFNCSEFLIIDFIYPIGIQSIHF